MMADFMLAWCIPCLSLQDAINTFFQDKPPNTGVSSYKRDAASVTESHLQVPFCNRLTFKIETGLCYCKNQKMLVTCDVVN